MSQECKICDRIIATETCVFGGDPIFYSTKNIVSCELESLPEPVMNLGTRWCIGEERRVERGEEKFGINSD